MIRKGIVDNSDDGKRNTIITMATATNHTLTSIT